jgi:hypothetical protein
MVGLLPDRPQRGKSTVRDLRGLAAEFESLFARHCREIEQGRVTGEKALQSWLIRDAQTHENLMHAINNASRATDDSVELAFVTDEISLPLEAGKIVSTMSTVRGGLLRS